MDSNINITFIIEILKSLGFKLEHGGYSHIFYLSKGNDSFVFSTRTGNIQYSPLKGISELLGEEKFFIKLNELYNYEL